MRASFDFPAANERRRNPLRRIYLRWLLIAFFLIIPAARAQQTESSPAKLIGDRIGKLRSLSDDVRTVETRNLALEIRALPSPAERLTLAVELSNFATEGDFGRSTLREIGSTILEAIGSIPDAPDSAFEELARLVHYEGVDLTPDNPRFRKALAELEDVDNIRRQSDFTLTDLSGKSWQLKSLTGNVVLVNFWATWCPPCRKEMPDLEALYNRLRGKGLIVLAISDEDQAKVQSFIDEQKYTYPILLDPEDIINKRFRIQGIPKSLVYDRTGKLVAQSSDMRTMNQFLEMLKQAGLTE